MRAEYAQNLKFRDHSGGVGEDDIKLDPEKVWREDVDWVHPVLDRDQRRGVVNTAMNLRLP
jgi:hypothetical protein